MIAQWDDAEQTMIRVERAGRIYFVPDDPDNIDRQALDGVEIAPYAPPPPPVPVEISDRQFFQALAIVGLISQADALAAVMTGALPPAFEAFVAALPAGEQFGARMALSGATIFRRDHPLTAAFGAASGKSPAEIDELFRLAASLT